MSKRRAGLGRRHVQESQEHAARAEVDQVNWNILGYPGSASGMIGVKMTWTFVPSMMSKALRLLGTAAISKGDMKLHEG